MPASTSIRWWAEPCAACCSPWAALGGVIWSWLPSTNSTGQVVLYVTERAVFRLSPEGVELLEVAPGIDIERDVVAHMAFPPIMRDVQLMDAGVFQPEWGRLAERVGGR